MTRSDYHKKWRSKNREYDLLRKRNDYAKQVTENWPGSLIRSMKHSSSPARGRGAGGHAKAVESEDMTKDDLLEIFEFQNRRCYWTGVALTPSNVVRDLFKPSADRLDPRGSHFLLNLVLSSLGANFARSNSSAEDTDNLFESIRLNRQPSTDPPLRWANQLYCNVSSNRNRKNFPKEESSIRGFRDLEEIYEIQNGYCIYSGMKFGTGLFQPSLDRIDSSKNYTKDNVVLCWKSLNCAKSTHNQETFRTWFEAVRVSSPPNR